MIWIGHDRRCKPEAHSLTLDVGENLSGLLSGIIGPAQKLDTVIAMLRGLAALPAELSLLREEVSIIHVLLTESGSAEVVAAINNLDRKVDEFMATQEERL